MKKVQRSDLLDYQTYDENREAYRQEIMAIKAPRRIHVGPVLTFLFENTQTIRYQVQEMMRAERIVREKDIQHELDTYNELVGDHGELGACLLIEIDNKEERDEKLRAWVELPEHIYMRFADGSREYATFDGRQVSDGKVSSVQYIMFKVGDRVPVALGCDLPALQVEADLNEEQRQALLSDARAPD